MKMNHHVCVLINLPLVIVNIMTNAFYVFCMVCPRHAERIKQPLKFLLLSLISCTIGYLMTITVMFFFDLSESSKLTQILYLVSACTLNISMTSSVWLNLFYYTQIVPAQHALFVWIKKNIKSVIYCICLLERTFYLFDFTVVFLNDIYFSGFGFSNNFTMDHDTLMSEGRHLKWLTYIHIFETATIKAYFFFCLVVMLMSSGSTVVYLSRHVGRMVAQGHSLSCPRFRGQVRVTVTGILQGVQYAICAVWIVFNFFSQQISTSFISPYIHYTVINLYMSGTTVNLGIGMVVFRRRAADIWIRATQWRKTQQQHNKEDDTEAQT
ncbi:uncharacterized protein [Trachinotus anak]|uniref:uncharacterized protein n=1 Tax=Trachinotus anak TaxID=443729 RepID=UPI0039F22BC9